MPEGAVSRTARTGVAVVAAAWTVLLSAGPALADHNPLAPQEGADSHAGLSVAEGLALYVLVPAAIMMLIWALVWLPGMVRGNRYRPHRGWSAAPVWFAGPADPVAAVESAPPGGAGRGGASGSW
jgi:hypothetical protein